MERTLGDVFVDTSALYALLDAADPEHPAARAAFGRLAASDNGLITHSGVVVESVALVHRRLGWRAVDRLLDDLLPLVDVRWVGPALHALAVAGFRASRSRTSLVDWTSFSLMREERLETAFAFDQDFVDQGFGLVR